MALNMAALLWRKTFSLLCWKGSIIAFAQRKTLSLLFKGVGKVALCSGGGIISSLQTVCYTNVLDEVFGTKSAQYIDHKMCRSTREPRRILFQGPIFPFLLLLKPQYSWDLGIHLRVPDLSEDSYSQALAFTHSLLHIFLLGRRATHREIHP